mmetsp:Transcript_48396/g.112164  ORF Transcript_48396/g.112164 Transcript_48396/m.112164 type:complete len:228 (+) Transcript_48396:291-974(+)
MRHVDLQCGKVGTHFALSSELLKLHPLYGANLVDVQFVKESLQPLHQSLAPLELFLCKGLAVFCRSVRGAVDEDADNDVQHSDHEDEDVEHEKAHIDWRHPKQRLHNGHPVDAPGDGHEERQHSHREGAAINPEVHRLLLRLLPVNPPSLQIFEVADHALGEDEGKHQDDKAQKEESPDHGLQRVHDLQHHDPQLVEVAHDAQDFHAPQHPEQPNCADKREIRRGDV